MIEQRIKYTDLNGNEKEKVAYFHFSKAELIEMQVSEEGGLDKIIQQIIDEQDQAKLIALFKTMILKAYGEVIGDGEGFYKDPQKTRIFEMSEAYSELFMSLVQDSDKAVAFVKGIMPNIAELNEKIDEKIAEVKSEQDKIESK